MGIAVDAHQHAPRRLYHAHHLADSSRHVLKQHHAELRAGSVECVVVEAQRVPVHDVNCNLQPFFVSTRRKQIEHYFRLIDGRDERAEPRCRNAECAATGGNVEETHARANARMLQPCVAQPHLAGCIGPIVSRRYPVPLSSCFHCSDLDWRRQHSQSMLGVAPRSLPQGLDCLL
jgi:hypothetical protein